MTTCPRFLLLAGFSLGLLALSEQGVAAPRKPPPPNLTTTSSVFRQGVSGQWKPTVWNGNITGSVFRPGVSGQWKPTVWNGNTTGSVFRPGVSGQWKPTGWNGNVTGSVFGPGVSGQWKPTVWKGNITGSVFRPGVSGQWKPTVWNRNVTGSVFSLAGPGVSGQWKPTVWNGNVTGLVYRPGVSGRWKPTVWNGNVIGSVFRPGISGQWKPTVWNGNVTGSVFRPGFTGLWKITVGISNCTDAMYRRGVTGQSNATDVNANSTVASGTTPSNDTSTDDATSSNKTSTDESASRAPEKADFVVYDSNGKPCLLASLNITIHFKYHVQEGLVRETYETVSKKNTQDGSRYEGTCEQSLSSLSITWNNETFTLNLTFSLKNKSEAIPNQIDMDVLPPGTNASAQTWSLHQVALSYNTANKDLFPGAYDPTEETVMAENLNLFRTPLGMSYMCKTPEVVTVEFKDVDLAFNYMHLMPFGATSEYFSNDTVECSGDMGTVPGKDESYTVPLIVAGVLASVVICILVVYATVRCVARRMRQADYKQME